MAEYGACAGFGTIQATPMKRESAPRVDTVLSLSNPLWIPDGSRDDHDRYGRSPEDSHGDRGSGVMQKSVHSDKENNGENKHSDRTELFQRETHFLLRQSEAGGQHSPDCHCEDSPFSTREALDKSGPRGCREE